MTQPGVPTPHTIEIASTNWKRALAAKIGVTLVSASLYLQRSHVELPIHGLRRIPPAGVLALTATATAPVIALLGYPFHEGLHWLGFLANDLRPRTLELRLASCNAPGSRLSRPRYAAVLTFPYLVLIPVAELLLRHPNTLLDGAGLLTLLPLTAIKDTTRVVEIRRAPRHLDWEDVEGKALGWPKPNADQQPAA